VGVERDRLDQHSAHVVGHADLGTGGVDWAVLRRNRPQPSDDSAGRDTPDLRQLRRLFGYTRPYRRSLAIGIGAVIVASGLTLALPVLSRDLFNSAFASDGGLASLGGLDRIALLLIAVFVTQALVNFLRVYTLALVGEGVVADLRKGLYRHLLGLPVRFFESRRTGEITSRLTSDISTVQSAVSNAVAQFVSQLIQFVGGAAILVVLNGRLTAVMLLVIPPVIVAGAYFGRRLRKISTRFQDSVAEANASAEEAIAGIRVVKSFTAEAVEGDRYDGQIDTSYLLARRRAFYRALFIPSIILAMFSGISVVLWVGSRQVAAGNLLPGDLISFLLLSLIIAGSVGTFTGLYSQLQEAIGASKRIFELLDTDSDLPRSADPLPLRRIEGGVAFDGVGFRYGDRGDGRVLSEISLRAEPGEVVALVGPSGAGKSTLVTLLPRFYDPTEGRIQLDGKDLRDLDLEELRGHVGIVPQETQLFSGSVLDNIRYGRPGADEREVTAAAVAANADGFIRAFPDGYATLVGERGVKLSGGQRQRVAIARALLKDPRLLILDEATSSLDSESEALVQDALDRLMQGRTTFVIAHRLSTVVGADRIVVMDGGQIVDEGSHATLLGRRGLYRMLFERQFGRATDPG
jgi:subfamily B ATP-binding cassette protein MsbA